MPARSKSSVGRVHDRLLLAGDGVVAVEGDVDRAERDLLPAPLLDQRREPLGERDAARVDADEGELGQVVVALDDLVRDARERAAEALGVQQSLRRRAVGDVRAHSVSPFRPLWTGLKGRRHPSGPGGRGEPRDRSRSERMFSKRAEALDTRSHAQASIAWCCVALLRRRPLRGAARGLERALDRSRRVDLRAPRPLALGDGLADALRHARLGLLPRLPRPDRLAAHARPTWGSASTVVQALQALAMSATGRRRLPLGPRATRRVAGARRRRADGRHPRSRLLGPRDERGRLLSGHDPGARGDRGRRSPGRHRTRQALALGCDRPRSSATHVRAAALVPALFVAVALQCGFERSSSRRGVRWACSRGRRPHAPSILAGFALAGPLERRLRRLRRRRRRLRARRGGRRRRLAPRRRLHPRCRHPARRARRMIGRVRRRARARPGRLRARRDRRSPGRSCSCSRSGSSPRAGSATSRRRGPAHRSRRRSSSSSASWLARGVPRPAPLDGARRISDRRARSSSCRWRGSRSRRPRSTRSAIIPLWRLAEPPRPQRWKSSTSSRSAVRIVASRSSSRRALRVVLPVARGGRARRRSRWSRRGRSSA